MKMKPIADKVIIKPVEEKEKKKSGLLIPEAAKDKTVEGHVVAIGPGQKGEPMQVKVGDRVIYREYSGHKITVEKEVYLVMHENDIDVIL